LAALLNRQVKRRLIEAGLGLRLTAIQAGDTLVSNDLNKGFLPVVGAQAEQSTQPSDGPRPVNLRTDLAQLADLIEIAFASSMDNSGRAAVQEMRTLSHMGMGLSILSGLNTLAQGMGTGHVWYSSGRLVGNVSVYPSQDPRVWVIVNVAVHPDFQRRGIAFQLMQATMDMIAQRGARAAILQVDADNPVARRLYSRLGFIDERGWTTWRRGGSYSPPPRFESEPHIHITHPRADEWQAEYALAEYVRPAEMGGLGWLKPLEKGQFKHSFWRQLRDWLNFRSKERLIIRSPDEQELLALMWIESGLASMATELTLLVHPDYEGLYDEALINTAVRRFGTSPIMVEHPTDRTATNGILRHYHFMPRREVVHMRWDVT
jgi:ribosomal protein S18 acetylase RimI-like enzyme